MKPALPLAVVLLAACGAPLPGDGLDAGGLADGGSEFDAGASSDAGVSDDAGQPFDSGTGSDAGPSSDGGAGFDAGAACPAGQLCVTSFPYSNFSDTSDAGVGVFNHYACAPASDESGAERIYRVTVPAAGFLSAAVYEQPGVDVDVHLLSALDPSACVARGNFHARADVTAGTWFVVVDTFGANAGAYRVDIGFLEPSRGPCGMATGLMSRVNDNGNSLPMPATGKMAVEAHLVTQEEPPPYPMTPREHLEAHGALSQSRTGLVMHRTQDWAPLEGGSFYGAGIGSPTLFPVADEGWYINMYWRSTSRPARGTRMIARAPNSNRAVVVAAGYETGPGDLSFAGGTPEETHFYLNTGHGSLMTIGIATDPTLPLGPRECSP